jgi:hypothetical protein
VTVHILEPGFFKTNILDEAAIFKAIDGTFNKLSKEMKDYWKKPEHPEKTADLSQVTDQLYHIMLYTSS